GAVPAFVARLVFSALAELRPREREEFIASTKNRMLGFLSHPVVEAALSSTEGVLRPRQLLRDNAILLFDLGTHGVLRQEDQEIFANLWLSELVHAILATPASERVPHFCL